MGPALLLPQPSEADGAAKLHRQHRYGILILPALVVAEQFGLPLPAVPALLGIGALAAQGRASIPLILGAIVVVALIADFGWYELGRRRGSSVLASLCRLSVEPDSCMRRATNLFAQYGVGTMLVAKFVPGLTTVVPPLAGIFTTGRVRFALYEIGGVLLWAGLWTGLGYVFSGAISLVAARVAMLERVLGLVLVTALGAYILTRYLRRWWLARSLRTDSSYAREVPAGSHL